LEGLAAAADEVADEQRQVAQQARSMQRRRDRGVSWARILDEEPSPTLLERLRRSGRRLTEAAGRASRTLIAGLSVEGESRRQIARRLGVSHQRVSAILNHTRRSSRPDA
jgi:DNA invertase Pin-like site-specific DNA recombinase